MSRTARLGAFIVVTLGVLAVGIFVIGSKQYLFTGTYRLGAQFATVAGLDEGAEVRIGGVHRGTVRSIVLPDKPNEKITVEMDVDSSTLNIVKKDSVASIETEGLLGNEYMAISFGSIGAGNVRSGDMIAGEPPLAMADLMKKTDVILDSSQKVLNNVTLTTASLTSISEKIDRGQGTVGSLINDKQIYDALAQTMVDVNATLVQAQAGATDFQENMEALKHSFFLSGYFKNRGYEDSAELAKDEITALPEIKPLKTFTYDAKQLFAKESDARLKDQKVLGPAGDYLSDTDYGLVVIVSYTGMTGDTAKSLVLTEGRAEVVREYLVENFSFDDTRMKTLGLGKKSDLGTSTGWGGIEVVVYPSGTAIPSAK